MLLLTYANLITDVVVAVKLLDDPSGSEVKVLANNS